jgi:prephenate dehydrogenase
MPDCGLPAAGAAVTPASVAVVGLGLIGGSLCRALRRRLPATRLVGITRNPATVERALRTGVCDQAGAGEELLARAEIAVICTPVDAMPHWLAACAAASPDLLVTDVGSTKSWVVDAAARLLPGRFLGGHPMAGSERSGWDAADPELFTGCTWVLTPAAPGLPERFAPWRATLEALGAHVAVLDPATHDAAAALISHLPFTVSAALMRATAADPAWETAGWWLAAGGMRDMSRLSGGDPAMEAAILQTNTQPVLAALDGLLTELAGVRSALADPDRLPEWFGAARAHHEAWVARREQAGRPIS